MSQPSKPPRKKTAPEPLDWRALAGGAALRGLSEVLASPVGETPAVAETIQPPPAQLPPASLPPVPPPPLPSPETPAPVPAPAISTQLPRKPAAPRPPAEGVTPPVRPAIWVDSNGRTYEAKRVFRIESAMQSLAIGEERVYRLLWDAAAPDATGGRALSIGYDRLAKLAGLNEKSIRDLMPKLAAKQAVEVIGAENSASRTGKTYRIFDSGEILRRQRAQDLTHGVKNGRAVEFVWVLKETGTPADTLSASEGVPPTEPLLGTPDVSLIRQALETYGPTTDSAAEALSSGALRVEPTASTAEIIHFIHQKGRAVASSAIPAKVAYLVVCVPPSLKGPEFLAYRTRQRQIEAARHRESAEILREQERQRAILADPAASPTEKHWARLALGLDETDASR